MTKLISWMPVAMGFIAMGLEYLNKAFEMMNAFTTWLIGVATLVYIITRTYYLIKNKGKDKK